MARSATTKTRTFLDDTRMRVRDYWSQRHASRRGRKWNWKGTSLPPEGAKVLEREAAGGDGKVVEGEGERMTFGVVGKWESRAVGGISKLGGKGGCSFPPSVFSTTPGPGAAASRMRGLWSPPAISIWFVR